MSGLSLKRALPLMVVVLVPLASGMALAARPLVSTEWLKQHLNDKNLVVLDVTTRRFHAARHIPGAVFSPFGKWREKRGDVVGMLPAPAKLEKLIGNLGIGNEDRVIIVPGGFGAGDVGVATRIFWTFKTLGHDNVSILDGGMRAWLKDRANPVETKINTPKPKTFTAHFTDKWLARAKDVEMAINGKGPQIIDNRPVAQHLGVTKSGAVVKYGSIPGAINVPEAWVLKGGKFRPVRQLKKLHALLGVKDGPAIHSCNTGHKASLGWFVRSQLLGHDDSRLYDGSLAEWSRLPPKTHPVTAKIDINE